MMSKPIGVCGLVVGACVVISSETLAQSLAAAAEQAGSRNRAAVKAYTNADLEDAATAPAPTPAVPESKPPADKPATTGPRSIVEESPGEGRVNVVTKVEKNSSAENEPYWRRVTKSVKDRIATAEAELATIAGRLETAGGADREALTDLQTKRQRDLQFLKAEYAGHVKRAEALGVPAEWLR